MTVGTDDHLLSGFVQRVEGMEKLLEDLLLALEELDVVEQKDVDTAISVFEGIGSFAPDRVNEIVEEVLRGDIVDNQFRVHSQGLMANGVEEMGFTEARSAIYEQGVVMGAGLLGNGHGGRPGKSVRLTHDKTLEAVPRYQVGRLGGSRKLLGRLHGRGIFPNGEWLLWRRDVADSVQRTLLARIGRPIGSIDEFAVFVTHPAQVKLGWRDKDEGIPGMVGF